MRDLTTVLLWWVIRGWKQLYDAYSKSCTRSPKDRYVLQFLVHCSFQYFYMALRYGLQPLP